MNSSPAAVLALRLCLSVCDLAARHPTTTSSPISADRQVSRGATSLISSASSKKLLRMFPYKIKHRTGVPINKAQKKHHDWNKNNRFYVICAQGGATCSLIYLLFSLLFRVYVLRHPFLTDHRCVRTCRSIRYKSNISTPSDATNVVTNEATGGREKTTLKRCN